MSETKIPGKKMPGKNAGLPSINPDTFDAASIVVQSQHGDKTAAALDKLAKLVEKSEVPAAVVVMNNFAKSLNKEGVEPVELRQSKQSMTRLIGDKRGFKTIDKELRKVWG